MGTSTKQRQTSFSGKLGIRKSNNAVVRPREYLTDGEVDRLIKAAAKTGRHGTIPDSPVLAQFSSK
jgi:hypothetical protein